MKELLKEEKYLCDLLKWTFNNEVIIVDKDIDLDLLFKIASNHKILALIYDALNKFELNHYQKNTLEDETNKVIMQNYHLLLLSKYILQILAENNIKALVLKGATIANYYPHFELRKSGDIDILVDIKNDIDKLIKIFKELQINIKDEQLAHHHISFITSDNIDIEIHTTMIEELANNRLSTYVKKINDEAFKHLDECDVIGVKLKCFDRVYNAYYLLLHMIQHFTRAGFGLKLILDFSLIFKEKFNEKEENLFKQLVIESGIENFTKIILAICIKYLGLNFDNVSFLVNEEDLKSDNIDIFLKEVFIAEEFGRVSKDRMVLLRDDSIKSMFKEFHHQMKLTYKRASKYIILWPILWIMMLIGFIYRNFTIRKISTFKILKEAKKRAKKLEKMELFKK